MNNRLAARALTFSALIGLTTAVYGQSPRTRVSLDADWRFAKGDPENVVDTLLYQNIKQWVIPDSMPFSTSTTRPTRPAGNLGAEIAYTLPTFDDSGWRKLDLPHDWAIEGPFNQSYSGSTGKLPWWGIGWYRKHLSIPQADAGKQFFLDVDGAMSHALVWLNGQFVGGWPYGYSSFRVDLTKYVKPGAENVLVIRLDNPNPSSRFYPGGGIYRNVWLVTTSPVHVGQWGTTITTHDVSDQSATVDVAVTVRNDANASGKVEVSTQIRDTDAVDTKTIDLSGPTSNVAQQLTIKTPKLWSTDHPNLYVAVTTVKQDGKTIDEYETPFGVRTIQFDPTKGFLLNGQLVRINGVCNHHDLGPLGAAINTRALERQIEILKEMGCNAIRTSHNPPAPELLDLCDRMGMLVMDEAFDCWARGKTTFDYGTLFTDWHEPDRRALIRRDRNHPSVILWSIGNEVSEQGRPNVGLPIVDDLIRIAKEEDPTRLTTMACNIQASQTNGFQRRIGVFGFNYQPGAYKRFHEANPDLPMISTESASTVSSRGEYFFPVSDDKAQGKLDFQVSSYDLYAPRWAMPPDTEFKGQDETPAVAGEFVWTGFDYLGEPTPYGGDSTLLLNFSDPAEQQKMADELKEFGKIKVPSRSSYFGIIDIDGFKKDRFYIYQARWRPDFPMAHLLPHWNWPDRVGQVTPVHVYTSGDEAELFINGKSMGRKKKEPLTYRIRWDDVKYEPGEVKVVAYKDGKEWVTSTEKTTGAPAKVMLEPDHKTIAADGSDLSFVTVSVADGEGVMVPRTKNHIKFEISGPGEIVAVDNGDATSQVSFQLPERDAYNGLCLVIVRGKRGEAGNITLKAVSEGLTAAETVIASH